MSTDPARDSDTRRVRNRRRRRRVFAGTFVVVVGILAAAGLAGAAAGVAQGPRATDVQIDPASAVAASGSRVIITTSQSLAKVHASQVKISPQTPFAVDTAGRSVGVRFTLPLWDDTDYTVTIHGMQGVGGGPRSTITERFRTPATAVYVLQRSESGDGDTIYRTDLTGKKKEPVYTNPHIEDFRATATHLVMSVRTDDDKAGLIITDIEGKHSRSLKLPGIGYVSQLQTADRGELIGYTFSDADLSASRGRESMLFIASLKDADARAKPTQVAVRGADPRVAEWRFVPDTDSILMQSFDGSLLLTGSAGQDATALGKAMDIDGIARGSSQAVVTRPDRIGVIDLSDAKETPLVVAKEDLGAFGSVTPLPDGSTVRTSGVLDAHGVPTGATNVSLVGVDGVVRRLFRAPSTDAVLQTCVSPSARYLAVTIAPDAVSNPYDTYQLPLPQRLETRVISLADGAEVGTLGGSSISWCQVPSS